MRNWKLFAGSMVSLGALIAACGGDDEDNGTGGGGEAGTATAGQAGEAGTGGTTAGQAGEAGTAGTGGSTAGAATGGAAGAGGAPAEDPLVERGRYLVNHVAACIDCHSPMGPMGPDPDHLLEGNPAFADLVPDDDEMGLVPTPNLTPDNDTGLGEWTDEEIKNAFLNGEKNDGTALFPIMPYFVFHNMSDDDADAIVAYLRSLEPVDNPIPDRQELPFPFEDPAEPVPADMIPDTTLADDDPDYESAQNGRYLAGMIGVCMECHTADAEQGSPVPIDVDNLFAGGKVFAAAEFGLPTPPFPEEIYSRNLTPDPTGIQGWTPEEVAGVLREGIDEEGDGICPPMPVGPMGAFGGLTEQDALDIGTFLTTIEPIETDDYPECVPPPPMAEGGAGGAGGAPEGGAGGAPEGGAGGAGGAP